LGGINNTNEKFFPGRAAGLRLWWDIDGKVCGYRKQLRELNPVLDPGRISGRWANPFIISPINSDRDYYD
jgi:hypothetical protein